MWVSGRATARLMAIMALGHITVSLRLLLGHHAWFIVRILDTIAQRHQPMVDGIIPLAIEGGLPGGGN